MIKMKQPTILGLDGKPIVLDQREQYHANRLQKEVNYRFKNDIGYEVNITTLTQVIKKVTQQKYFEIAPADYIPIRVGEGAWSTSITTFRSFDAASPFEAGVINTGGNNSRLASADAGVDSINVKVYPWAKAIGWTIFDLEYAAKSGNWDIVAAKEGARKRNWDLGIQSVAFLGTKGLNGIGGTSLGLMNQAGVTNNTSIITKPISSFTPTELSAFMGTIMEVYRKQVNRTAWPTTFLIPESDYNGLMAQASPTFPIKSILEVMEDGFKAITHNPNFKILPNPYGDKAFSGYTTQNYVLYNNSDESIRMDIPVDYTSTGGQNTIDGFSFQNVAYGQFTGVQAYRPQEILYFTYTPAP